MGADLSGRRGYMGMVADGGEEWWGFVEPPPDFLGLGTLSEGFH